MIGSDIAYRFEQADKQHLYVKLKTIFDAWRTNKRVILNERSIDITIRFIAAEVSRPRLLKGMIERVTL